MNETRRVHRSQDEKAEQEQIKKIGATLVRLRTPIERPVEEINDFASTLTLTRIIINLAIGVIWQIAALAGE